MCSHFGDVDPRQVLHDQGQFLHDGHDLVGQLVSSDVTLAAGHHGDLPRVAQGLGDFRRHLDKQGSCYVRNP